MAAMVISGMPAKPQTAKRKEQPDALPAPILRPEKLAKLVGQVRGNATISPACEAMLLELTQDFVDSAAKAATELGLFACSHPCRPSQTLLFSAIATGFVCVCLCRSLWQCHAKFDR